MGPVVLTPWYQHTPGSHLPPKKVYKLHGTRGYQVDQVVCVESELEGGKIRGRELSGQVGCQGNKRIEVSEGRKSVNVNGQEKGKGVLGRQAEEEKEKDVLKEGPTVIDLETQTVQPGLGPARVEDLDIVKEDIGLREKVVLFDYPSPESPTIKYGGANFTKDQLEKCKAVCGEGATRIYPKKKDYFKGFPISPPPKFEANESKYSVEFPSEENTATEEGQYKIQEEEEGQLITRVQQALILKRPRLTNQSKEQRLEEVQHVGNREKHKKGG